VQVPLEKVPSGRFKREGLSGEFPQKKMQGVFKWDFLEGRSQWEYSSAEVPPKRFHHAGSDVRGSI